MSLRAYGHGWHFSDILGVATVLRARYGEWGRPSQTVGSRHRDLSSAPSELGWLWTPQRRRGVCEKFLAQYTGPFVVVKRVGEVNYVLPRLTTTGRPSKTTQVVHVARLKRYNSHTTQ